MSVQSAGDRGNVVPWDEHNNAFPSRITDSTNKLRLTYGKNYFGVRDCVMK